METFITQLITELDKGDVDAAGWSHGSISGKHSSRLGQLLFVLPLALVDGDL
jgi:hypothetical protein